MIVRINLALFIFVFALPSYAYNFHPTATEWLVWPEYCKAKYVSGTVVGMNSKYAGTISKSVIKKWAITLGSAWYGLHHYCAGMSYLGRAIRTHDQVEKKRLLKHVISETTFTFQRTDNNNIIKADMAALMAQANWYAGKIKEALYILDHELSINNKYERLYTAKAAILKSKGDLAEAIHVLETGLKLVPRPSSELYYFLGMYLFEKGDKKASLLYAEQAYSMGYPLNALKNKLIAAGLWNK